MKCETCGHEAPPRAVICPECGEILPKPQAQAGDQTTPETDHIPQGFATPFLSASPEALEQATAQDPQQARQEIQIRKNTLRRRIIALSVAGVVVLAVVLYVVFLGGYKLAAYRYFKGWDKESGGLYLGLAPDPFLDYLEDTYDMTQREIKASLGDYFAWWNQEQGNTGRSYDLSQKTKLDQSQLQELEAELYTEYGISVDISKGLEARYQVTMGDQTNSETVTFVKIGMKWCCVEAMELIDFVCEYDGYNQW